MSELQIETILTDFPRKLTLLGEGQQNDNATLLDYIKPYDCDDRKVKFVVVDARHVNCGDAKPPLRILNVAPPKRGPELTAELTEKMHKSTLRREQFIDGIVQRSRLYNEKITKARERMLAKRVQQTQNVEKELHDKRYAAQRTREKIVHDKLERIKKHMEYAELVRSKKMAKGAT